jgi:hypothetical protein
VFHPRRLLRRLERDEQRPDAPASGPTGAGIQQNSVLIENRIHPLRRTGAFFFVCAEQGRVTFMLGCDFTGSTFGYFTLREAQGAEARLPGSV